MNSFNLKMASSKRISCPTGFTLVEVIITLAILGVLAGIFVGALRGLQSGDSIDRGATLIYNDLLIIRSRALSTNQNHRLNFSSKYAWAIEYYDDATTSWVQSGGNRTMPTDTYLTDSSFTNAGANLYATPRGLFEFQGITVGTPYVKVTGLGASRFKSIYVDVGGAISIQNE